MPEYDDIENEEGSDRADRIEIDLGGRVCLIRVDDLGEAHVVGASCPHCRAALRVIGQGRSIGGRDYYRADGICRSCAAPIGEIRAYVDTIFGLEADLRVLSDRARVY